MALRLNSDLGESFGAWRIGMDAEVMQYIDQANIACGFHAGDPLVMQQTLALAKANGVCVGAHPGYPDLVGFGRRSLHCAPAELAALLQYQIAALDGMALSQGLQISYVKPHGALYNDMMADSALRQLIMRSVADYYRPLVLMIQATPDAPAHREEAQQAGIELLLEAFADRCYADDGKLLARSKPGAVHSKEKMLAQVQQLAETGTVTTQNGTRLRLDADSLCVHGDNLAGIEALAEIRALIHQAAALS